jgi:methyl-accepting chemotaxis protein
VISKKQSRVLDLSAAVAELREIPAGIQRIIDELAKAEDLGKNSVDVANRGNKISARNRDQLGALRKQLQEAVGRVGRLTERSQEVTKIAKIVEDLAHRTNMIALNASIQAGEAGDRASGFSAVTDEIERLAERADNTNKQISAINKSINVEIAEVERALVAANKQISEISQGVLETAGAVTEVEKYISQFLNLQKNLNLKSHEQAARFEMAYRAFESQIGESESILADLKHSEQAASTMLGAIRNIENSATAFKLAEPADEEMPGELLARYLSEVQEPETEPAEVI